MEARCSCAVVRDLQERDSKRETASEVDLNDLDGCDGSHVAALVPHCWSVSPGVGVHVVYLHRIQLLCPIKPSYRHNLPVENSPTHSSPRRVHGCQSCPGVVCGVVALQHAQTVLLVMASKDVDESPQAYHTHCTATKSHVGDSMPLVVGVVITFHCVQEHAGMASSDGVDPVVMRNHSGTVPPHAHASDALPLLRLGAIPLARS